jgi:hypothetical protein
MHVVNGIKKLPGLKTLYENYGIFMSKISGIAYERSLSMTHVLMNRLHAYACLPNGYSVLLASGEGHTPQIADILIQQYNARELGFEQ